MRAYRRGRRALDLERFAARCAHAESNKVVALCATMFRRFGGVHGFCQVWKAEFDAACESAPGSRRVCTMLDAMLTGLLQASDAAQDPHDYELSLVSDEDLARRLRQEILDLVRDDPRLAIAAAKDLGWTVVPPDEEPS